MSTPNLPVRYEIRSTGGTGSLDQICCSVISEGGLGENGVLRGIATTDTTTALTATNANIVYAALMIRLSESHLGSTILLKDISILATTNNNLRWTLSLNPVVAGNFNFIAVPNSCVEYAFGSSANTISNTDTGLGVILHQGFISTLDRILSEELQNALRAGASISGIRDVICLSVQSLTNNATVFTALNWRELS